MSRCKNCGKFIDEIEKRAMCPYCGTGIARTSQILDEYNRPEDYSCILHPIGEECPSEQDSRARENESRQRFGTAADSRRSEKREQPRRRQEPPSCESDTGGGQAANLQKTKDQALSILAYLGGFVIFPIFSLSACSNYVRFHTNQGLALFLFTLILLALESFLKKFSLFNSYYFLLQIFRILKIIPNILSIYGAYNALMGKTRRLPIVGGFNIIKPKNNLF